MSCHLSLTAIDRTQGGAVMVTMNARHARCRHGSVAPTLAGFVAKRSWSTEFERRTPRYTTRLAKVPVVRAEPSCPPPTTRP